MEQVTAGGDEREDEDEEGGGVKEHNCKNGDTHTAFTSQQKQ
jgi:hypothetical protein